MQLCLLSAVAGMHELAIKLLCNHTSALSNPSWEEGGRVGKPWAGLRCVLNLLVTRLGEGRVTGGLDQQSIPTSLD